MPCTSMYGMYIWENDRIFRQTPAGLQVSVVCMKNMQQEAVQTTGENIDESADNRTYSQSIRRKDSF